MSRAQLQRSLALWKRKLAYRKARLKLVRTAAHKRVNRRDVVTDREAAHIHKWERLVEEAQRMVARRTKQLIAARPLSDRAYRFAQTLIGVMEQGGNNVGPMVSKIIRANGGSPGEAWCGDFMAFVYRAVGSKSVTRSWAAVRLLRGLVGVVPTSRPVTGDLVRFNFDHVGMFVKDNKDGTIETIEGNTGASGAVSDSATGGDGVYRKVRSKLLVRDYLHITK